ncbi:MAG TPA: pyruvate dehydrogenase complex dihydrolipoamide acetyltransferase [Saprospiraceae bacterium]|nr:pyruvate dehydrogenase complex dihydrolipoamide acetyltransferase [Saprospiraceae bacterium]HMX82068.1 pyruvate dehydrogenase complex dihydrolipoamide acetyltransferase [Saprospiraceae bacterium]HMX85049.1 pyruvate dehydrogenase complex dihydrolipoamide acetyltransferase [Saprospiraceae bacterium]HMZ72143.1 pyruvate dehydrogenase complex dihydrolipoamide acetyltransferase [Saprospiraceae bacterium]HNA42331.1 pyruvate dehydrogenase complex dihydrolipoamide acetyltransferase [Saprospiraceae ba
MAEVIRMPRMSDTMEEGVIVSWQKKVGDTVEPGTVLAEVETDKAVMELESFNEGVLLHIVVESGPVKVNGVLAVVGQAGEDYKPALDAAGAGSSVPATKEVAAAPSESPAVTATPTTVPVATEDTGRIKASPLAKSMASQAGVDLKAVKGSGDFGRIIKKDVEEFIQSGSKTTSAPVAVSAPAYIAVASGQDVDIPLSQMRKTIARRLSESMFTAPHFYLSMDINMDRAVEVRKLINESEGKKISFNDLVVKAVAMALRHHPVINSSWLGDKIRQNGNINIGVAVAVDEGLLVPVTRNTDMMSLSQISDTVKQLAGKAKERKLQPDEMQGNTFTVSNLGMFDIESFTAIINPPDSCIMAVGSIVQKPIVKNGQIVVGNMMKVMLSCDHRVVDGASGARFLQTFKNYLEEPVRMLA